MASAALELLISMKDQASGQLDALAGSLKGVGLLAGGAVAAGVAAVGYAAVSAASDLNQAQNDLQANLGVTAARADELGALGTTIWQNNWGGSIADVNAAIIETQKQFAGLGGIADDETQKIVQAGFAMADTFGIDVNEAISAQKTLMAEFGVSAQEAGDLVVKGFQSGLNSSDDFLDTIGEYSNQFSAGGASAQEFFSLLETGIGSGVLGTDKAADAFKEFSVRIQDGSTATADGLKALGLNVTDITAKLNSGELTKADLFQQVISGLNQAENSTVAWQAGVNLLGTQFEDLGPQIVANMDMASDTFANVAGATDSLNAKYANWGSLWEGIQRQVIGALLPISEDLLGLANNAMPMVTDAAAAVSNGIAAVIDWFKNSGEASNVLGGIVAWLSDVWTGTLQPALQTVMDVFTSQVLPILRDLATAVAPLLGAAIQVLAGFWTDVLQPALRLLWTIFTTLILPVLADVASWLKTNLPPAIQATANFLTGTLFPALRTVYDFISTNVVPVIETLVDWLRDNLPPAIQAASGALSTAGSAISAAAGWFDNISNAISGVIGWLRDLAAAWNSMSPPSWVVGKSPPPMAKWFDYIAESTAGAVEQFDRLALPDVSMPRLQTASAAPGGAGTVITVNIQGGTARERTDARIGVDAALDAAGVRALNRIRSGS